MNAPARRIILNPASPREARTAAERLVRALELRATTTSEESEGWLRTFVWTNSEADSDEVVKLGTNRHTRAQFAVVHEHDPDRDYVIINWKKLPCP